MLYCFTLYVRSLIQLKPNKSSHHTLPLSLSQITAFISFLLDHGIQYQNRHARHARPLWEQNMPRNEAQNLIKNGSHKNEEELCYCCVNKSKNRKYTMVSCTTHVYCLLNLIIILLYYVYICESL